MSRKTLISVGAGLVALAASLALFTTDKPRASNPEFKEELLVFQFELERQELLQNQAKHKQQTAEAQQKLQDRVKQSLQKPPEPEVLPPKQEQPVTPEVLPAAPQELIPHRHRGLFFRSRHLRFEESCPLP